MTSQQTDMPDISRENESPQAGQPSNDDKLTQILNNLKEGRKHWARWRIDAREAYDFFAGVQWSEEDVRILEDQLRPVVTFNRTARTINAVKGLEVQNRQEVRYLPRRQNQDAPGPNGLTDAGFGEMLTSAAKWVREGSNAEDEESESFEDCLISGVGWTETRMDYEEDQEGKILIDRVDPLEMVVDPESTKRNFDDAKWVARVKQFTKQQIQERWPHAAEYMVSQFWNDLAAEPHDAQHAYLYQNDQSDKLQKNNLITVIQYQDYEKYNVYKVSTPSGNILEFPEERYSAVSDIIDQNNLKAIKMPKRRYYQCFLIGNQIIEEDELKANHFTFRAITGIRDRNRNTWFGLIQLMKDPQRWANKWLSQIQHIINSNAKGGLFIESGAAANIRKLEEEWPKPNAIIELNPGGMGKILQRETPQFPQGVDQLLQYAIQSINDIPGINLELIGMTNRDQPNVLEQSRKQAGITILATFFDSLRRYRKVQGNLLAYFIREYISDGRLVRVLGPEGARYVPLIKDAVSFDYDIIVDDAPTSPNMKERTFEVLAQILPLCLQAQIPVPPDILDYAPLPDNLIQKWKQMIMQKMNDPKNQQMQQMQQVHAQLDAEQKQANIQKTSADTAASYAKATHDQMLSQTHMPKTSSEIAMNYAKAEQQHALGQDESALAQHRMGIDSQQHQAKMEQMAADQDRKNLELLLNQHRKMIETQMNHDIKQQQLKNQQMNQINKGENP